MGLLTSALSHLALGAGTRREFLTAAARGLGANMAPDVRQVRQCRIQLLVAFYETTTAHSTYLF